MAVADHVLQIIKHFNSKTRISVSGYVGEEPAILIGMQLELTQNPRDTGGGFSLRIPA